MAPVSRSSQLRGDRGSATAETAIVLPVVVILVLLIVITGGGIGTQVTLENAARGAARELARGEDPAGARAAAQRLAGPGSAISITEDGPWVRVEVTRTLRIEGGVLGGIAWELTADAEARREPHLVGAPSAGGGP